jgi:adenylate kinase
VRIVLLGAPGSGKGTQAALLKEMYGIPHISTGDILRQEVAEGTELGRKAESYMADGALVPDALILEMMEARLLQPDTRRGWLLDGFPRTVEQAEGLATLTARIGQKVNAGVILHVDPEVVVRRLSGRRVCDSCQGVTSVREVQGGACPLCGGKLSLRPDDEPEVVRRRIIVFDKQTRPVFEFFRRRYDVIDVDASRTIDEVTEALRRALDRYDHP